MRIPLPRIVYPLICLTWAAVMLYFYQSGRLVRYLAPDFRNFCLIGGLGLGVIGLFVLLTSSEEVDCGQDHSEGDPHDHESNEMHPLTSAVLMLAPLLFALFSTKDGFSALALSRKALYDAPSSKNVFLASALPPLTIEEIEKTHRKSTTGEYEFNLMELYFAIGDPELLKLIDGMKVVTEGRMVAERDNNANGTRKRLYRLFITCCAADARAVPIIAEFGKTPPNVEENSWMKLTGVIRFPMENGARQAVLEVETSEKSDPPWEESFMRQQ